MNYLGMLKNVFLFFNKIQACLRDLVFLYLHLFSLSVIEANMSSDDKSLIAETHTINLSDLQRKTFLKV